MVAILYLSGKKEGVPAPFSAFLSINYNPAPSSSGFLPSSTTSIGW